MNVTLKEDLIAYEYYFTAADGVKAAGCPDERAENTSPSLELLTICVLVLKNGCTVVGEAYCAARSDICRRMAHSAALAKITGEFP